MLNEKGLIAVLIVLMVFMTAGLAVASETLTIQGSSTVLPIAQKAAEDYMKENDVNITVRGGGSGNGIAALLDGAVDIANASRFIKDEEVKNAVDNDIYPVPHRVAKDAIAVIVNPANSVNELTLDEIKGIYTGKITNWKEVGGKDKEIVVVSRDSSSGTFAVFNDVANDGSIDGNSIRVAPSALLQSSNGTVAGTVAETEGAIGYVGLGYLDDSLQTVKVNGDLPTSASYSMTRPLYMFTDGWPTGITKDFINFVLSPVGQDIVKNQDFVPLY